MPEGDVDLDEVGDNAELATGGNLTSTTPLETVDGGRGVPAWQAVVVCGDATCVDPADVNRRGVPTYLSILVCGTALCATGYEDTDQNGIPDWISFVLAGVRNGPESLSSLDANHDGLTDMSQLMNCLIAEDLAETGLKILPWLVAAAVAAVALGFWLRNRRKGDRDGMTRSSDAETAAVMAGAGMAFAGLNPNSLGAVLVHGARALRGFARTLRLRLSRLVRRLTHVPRVALTVVVTVAVVVVGTVTPQVASAATLADRAAAETLAEVQKAAEPTAHESNTPSSSPVTEPTGDPLGSGTVNPGKESTITADSIGVDATFSGEKIAEKLDVVVTQLPKAVAQVAEAETGGTAVSVPVDISATTAAGNDVTQFPSTSTVVPGAGTIPDGEKDVKTGVALSIKVDPAQLEGLDTSQLKIYTREKPGDPWTALPSYYDEESGTVKADSYHLSELVVIGGKIEATKGPTIVLDPDNDSGFAETPLPAVTELPYNIRLAQGVRDLLTQACLANVVITREDPGQGTVDPATRAATAAAANPDLFATFGFNTLDGHAWGSDADAAEGGTQVYTYGGADDDALSNTVNGVMHDWTDRQSKIEPSHDSQNIPEVEFAGVPGAKTHLEVLFMDNNFDRVVIDNGFDKIIGGVATGFKTYLESKGFECTNPVQGGWPTPPTDAEKQRWRDLGYQNYLLYGAEPVSMSTGNLIESQKIFDLTGPGGSETNVGLVYNSQDGRESRVGYSWTFGAGARAQRFSDNSVMVVRNDGASFTFASNGAGGYNSEAGVNQTLSEAGGGQLLLTSVDGETWQFDAADIDGIGELVKHTDRQGHTTTLTYGALDEDQQHFLPLTSITDAGGQTIQVGNDIQGHITSFTHPDGRVWQLSYDGAGNLSTITNPDGTTRTFTYDGAHQMLTATDGLGVTYLTNVYDASGRVSQQTDADGYLRTFDYSTPGKTVYTDQEGQKTTYLYDSQARVTAKIDAAGNSTAYTYDENNNVTSYTDQADHVWKYSYDAGAHVTQTTLPDGSDIKYTYTPTGEIASMTDLGGPNGAPRTTAYQLDPLGLVTQTTLPTGDVLGSAYDGQGNLTTATSAAGAVTQYGYDGHGNVTSVTDPDGNVTQLAYDSANRATSVTDPIGRVTSYAWDVQDRLQSKTDPTGAVTSYAYDANDHLLSSTDALGNVTSYTWDNRFNLTSWTAPDGGVTHYEYNKEDKLTKVTDPLGGVVTYGLNAMWNVTKITDPNGGVWKREFDQIGNLTASTAPDGGVTSYDYDTLSRPTTVTDPNGAVTETRYDKVGQVTDTTDASNQRISYVYDLLGQLTEVTDQAGKTATLEYDKDGHPVTSTDRQGNSTTLAYDPAGRLTSTTDPMGGTKTFSYDSAGQVTALTDELNRTTTFAYDGQGNTTGITNPLGQTTLSSYDPLGRVKTVTDPNGNDTTRDYTSTGLVSTITDAVGNATAYGYDLNGQQTSLVDPLGKETRYSYDPAGQLTKVIEGYKSGATPSSDVNVTTSYGYTPTGGLAAITDANGHITSFDYDLAGRVVTETNPLGNTWKYDYTPTGRLANQNDPNGVTTNYAYSPTGNVTSVGYTGGQTTTLGYDNNGRAVSMVDSTGTSGWKYDKNGNQIEQIDAKGKRLDYAYDAANQLTSLTLPTGESIGYTYDNAGRPLAQKSDWGTLAYEWDPAGNLTKTTRSTGLNTSYSYDAANRVTQIAHLTPTDADPSAPSGAVDAQQATACAVECLPVADFLKQRTVPTPTPVATQGAGLVFDYTYDKDSNVESATRTITGSGTASDQSSTPSTPTAPVPASPAPVIGGKSVVVKDARSYTYDNLNRLSSSTGTLSSSTYSYDPAGNRTAATVTTAEQTVTTDASYNLANQLTGATVTGSQTSTDSYNYDGNGNRTSQTEGSATTQYSYGPDNKLSTVTTPDRTATYSYDGVGRQTGSTQTTSLGTQSTDVTFDGAQPVQQTNTVSGITTQLRDAQGNISADVTSDGTKWDLLDRLGSTSAQAVGGSVTQLANFADYGTQNFETDGWDTTTNYTGQTTDPGLGLNTYLTRTYDPTTGAWLQQDKWRGLLEQPQTLSRYAYVTNNPTSDTDLLGYMGADRMETYATAHDCHWISVSRCVPNNRTINDQTSPGTPAAQRPPTASPSQPEVQTSEGDTTTEEDRHAEEAKAGFDLFFEILGSVGAVVNAIKPLLFLFGALGTIILVLGTLAGIASTVYSCAQAIFGEHSTGDIIGCAIGALSIALGLSSQFILGAIKDGAEAVKSADQALKAFGISLDALDQLIGWLS
ncbi:RHS repeat-associated core domain-containing protein [Agreia sp. PsM10]|uniref:RHS repeat-associated core domain-containing protein n=1 Tax=Agreia sp. PsM10 TaxID=3030533 RepID=UPI00263B72BB|nr:RHS repeat-associated core domain-containing protein [Agreia sp. PsM10]MDN4640552.1 RHS repeat-associated core domain-containing protein [Agreia sp. PsM10]